MEILWSFFAIDSTRKIYKYYKINVNETVAKKIKSEIFRFVKQLKKHPITRVIPNAGSGGFRWLDSFLIFGYENKTECALKSCTYASPLTVVWHLKRGSITEISAPKHF